MTWADAVGWGSSVLLFATITTQVHRQWTQRSSEGVSVWLYVGQTAASAGFLIYSVAIANWVFVVTNVMMVGSALTGLGLFWRDRGRG